MPLYFGNKVKNNNNFIEIRPKSLAEKRTNRKIYLHDKKKKKSHSISLFYMTFPGLLLAFLWFFKAVGMLYFSIFFSD